MSLGSAGSIHLCASPTDGDWGHLASDSLAAADANKILDLFGPDYYVSAEAVRDSISAESIFNLIHNDSVIKLDCIARKN